MYRMVFATLFMLSLLLEGRPSLALPNSDETLSMAPRAVLDDQYRHVEVEDTSVIMAQRRSGWRGGGHNYRLQQQQMMRQQQMQRQQQQMQRQRMQQQRQQQAQQRQKMMQQRQQQQAAMRARQQQMVAQRQRLIQQRKAAVQRQQQRMQQRQNQQLQAARNQIQRNQQVARSRIVRQDQQRRLKQIRDDAKRFEQQKTTARNSTDLSIAASLRGSGLAAVRSTSFTNRLNTTSTKLQKLRGQPGTAQVRPNAAKFATDNDGKVAALRKQFRNCSGSECRCSFHGDTLVITKRGMVPIRSIREGEDFVWARDQQTEKAGWKSVSAHYSNVYDVVVDIRVRYADGATGLIQSNRLHPFFAVSTEQWPQILLSGIQTSNDVHPGQWIEAAFLRPNDRLMQADNNLATVLDISIRRESFRAFNITVSDFHTYFVSSHRNNVSGVWVHNDCPPGSNVKSKLWTGTKGRTPAQNAYRHWKDHRSDFPNLKNAAQYQKAANRFLNSPPAGTLTKTRADGDIIRYNPRTNTFAVMTKGGVPRTMFKPDPKRHGYKTNMDYFNAQ